MKTPLKTLIAALSALFTFTLTAAAVAQELKIGFVYVGPIGDHGWTYRHDEGRRAIEQALGNRVKTTFVESVSEGQDAERVIRKLATEGNGLIFTTSFGYMNSTIKVARQFPEIKFEHATGYKRAANVSTYIGRFYEGRYVCGRIAGRMSKSGVVGYVASFPIPEVVRGINAFMLGMQSVRPDARIKVVWVNSWYDPGKESDAAKALIDQGADIIAQHTDSPAPLQVAESRGVFAFGQASDNRAFAPKAHLTAIIDDWGPYYIDRARAVLDGTWKSGDVWDGLATGMVAMAPYNDDLMPRDAINDARNIEEAIKHGRLHPFAGPITRQDGTLAAAKGEILDDKTLLGMNWYVRGVEGKLPN